MSPADAPPRRLWLVFFGDAQETLWWVRGLRPGFRHVSAAAYYADQERWVYVNPTRLGLIVEVWRPDEFGARLGQLAAESAAIVRMPSRADLPCLPGAAWCVGVVKALLGIRSCALAPLGLYRHLLANGAEPVEVPVGESVQGSLPSAAGLPSHGAATAGTGARGG